MEHLDVDVDPRSMTDFPRSWFSGRLDSISIENRGLRAAMRLHLRAGGSAAR